eukprot:scaffold370362_cov24-Attheya_sp.AAC.1
MEELKVGFFGEFLHRFKSVFVVVEATGKVDNLAKERKVGFVRHETQHNEIGVLPVHAVAGVGLVARLMAHVTNVLHNLVLSLTGHFVSRENDLEVAPQRILLDLFPNKVLDGIGHPCHELCPR